MCQILLPAVPVVHQLITTILMFSNFQDKNIGSDRIKSNNNNNISDNINYTYLKIGIYNIKGFNLETKQREFFDEYNSLNLDIIGITETKLSNTQSKYTMNNNKHYKSWWTGDEEKSKTGGVGIAIKFGLDKHVANIIRIMGRIISMDLKFKGSTTIRIINIYVQCNEKDRDKREKLFNELLKLIKEADQRKFHLVIMGDFNADMERYIAKNKLATKGKYRILQMLLDKGLYDTQKVTCTDNLHHTWIRNENTQRRIDYIWISEGLIQDLIVTKVNQNEMLTTDHYLLIMTLEGNKILGKRTKAYEKKKKITRNIFNLEKMTD